MSGNGDTAKSKVSAQDAGTQGSHGPTAETREWQVLTAVIDNAVRAEQEAADRSAAFQDEGSDYPALPLGPQKMPEPGSTDWREMAGPAAREDARRHPQTPEEYKKMVELTAALRPSLDTLDTQ